jgi:hypothetical protein
MLQVDQNLAKFEIFIYFDLQWLKLTFKQQNLYIFRFTEQFAIRKTTISIHRATSIFDPHMRIFNLQGLGAHQSFLRVRRDQFLPNCKKTHPIMQWHFFQGVISNI